MAEYKVSLPANLELSVEVTEHPIHFSIRFPNGGEVNFDHSPSESGPSVSRIDVDGLLKKEVQSSGRFRVGQKKADGSRDDDPEIEYGPPGGPHR
jgi:hypothetical protein